MHLLQKDGSFTNCMIVNGIDLSALTPHMPAQNFPEEVSGRVVHIDADFLAYMVSYEREGNIIELNDMQHNTRVAVEKIRKLAGAQAVHLHLTPGTSTKGDRNAIAIQKEYQGNRKDKPKPAKLHIMRTWMGQAFPATLCQLYEADDSMSSMQYKAIASGAQNLSIICSKDKDLDMVPGLHLDWVSGEIKTADTFGEIWLDTSGSSIKLKGLGQKFFWAQMLMGDSADNIQGIPVVMNEHMSKPKKCGPAMAYSMLCDIKTNRDAFLYVKQCYENTGKFVGYKHWETGADVPWQLVFVSEAKLLWMRRDPNKSDDVLQWFKEIMA